MENMNAYVLTHRDTNKEIDIETYSKAHKYILQLNEQLKQALDIELRIVKLNSYAIEKCQKMIRENGLSHIMSLVRIQEEVMPKVTNPHHRFLIVQMLRDKLLRLAPQQELVIVDNYIFPSHGFRDSNSQQEYINMLDDILRPTIKQIKSLIFVTKSPFNKDLYSKLIHLFLSLNPNLSITCDITEDFHDRFWIVDRRDGLFIGTSLNGIGKKYALVDNIKENDVKEIVRALETRGSI